MFTVKKTMPRNVQVKNSNQLVSKLKNFQFLLFVSIIETDTTLNKDTIKDIHFKMPSGTDSSGYGVNKKVSIRDRGGKMRWVDLTSTFYPFVHIVFNTVYFMRRNTKRNVEKYC